MAADDLATQVARASAAMVLTEYEYNILLPAGSLPEITSARLLCQT